MASDYDDEEDFRAEDIYGDIECDEAVKRILFDTDSEFEGFPASDFPYN